MYELLKAALLDKKTFAQAFLSYTVEVMNELWPQKSLKQGIELLQATTKFEECLDTVGTEILQKMNDWIPFKTLVEATKVKEISFKETSRQDQVILVFSLKRGEKVLETTRTRAKLMRSAYRLLHMKSIIKEGFLEETQYLVKQKSDSQNSAIWAFLCTRYWNELCVDLALVLDHSRLLEIINVPQTTHAD